MIDVVLAGVGGQGINLAAKIIAVASASCGWNVKTCDSAGIAQRSGSVLSHVRIADNGEAILSSRVMRGAADLILAFEPLEAARSLPYLSTSGTLFTATTPIEPVAATLESFEYNVDEVLQNIQISIYNTAAHNIPKGPNSIAQPKFVPIDDAMAIKSAGGDRKTLTSILLAEAVRARVLPFDVNVLLRAVRACVKPDYFEVNQRAISMILAQ